MTQPGKEKKGEHRHREGSAVPGVPLHVELRVLVAITRNTSPNNKSCNKTRTGSSLTD